MTAEITSRELEGVIAEQVQQALYSGAVLLAKGGNILFEQASGLANRRYNVSNNLQTKFNLGSMNKMFTGVAILQLVQASHIALQDRVGKHLPDYPNREVAEKVTVHQLLTHTSGLGSYWNEKYEMGAKNRFQRLQDFIALFVSDPLQFEPGTRWSYSNAGFYVLGAIIEAITHQSYFDYVREHVYQIAGMKDTDCYEMDDPVPNLAIGYTKFEWDEDGRPREGTKLRSNLFLHVYKGGPAGGGYSTVHDMLRFTVALRSHKLLDRLHTDLLTSRKVDTGIANKRFGYGFLEYEYEGIRITGHSGGFAGICANLDIFPDADYVSVVLANDDGQGALKIIEHIRNLVVAL